MSERLDIVAALAAFRRIAQARGWQPLHNPGNLAAAISVEAGELLEIFQWLDVEAARAIADTPAQKEAVAGEIADILLYMLELCRQLDIDLAAAVDAKIAANERRFL